MPEASVSVPGVSGSLPEVSGDVSVPPVSGADVNVDVPSADVDAALTSASIDVPGECKIFVLRFLRVQQYATPHKEVLFLPRLRIL